jgi:hypothetical protein
MQIINQLTENTNNETVDGFIAELDGVPQKQPLLRRRCTSGPRRL